MATQYSLTLKNNSSSRGSFAVFQQPPPAHALSGTVFSLAWLTRPVDSGTQATFQWTEDHSFVASETGVLKPGVVIAAPETVAADPAGQNFIRLTADSSGAACFAPSDACGSVGSLTIEQGADVVPDRTAVGVGMSGAGTFVVQAKPNTTMVFTPHPNYWVTFGDFQPGQVMDIDNVTGAVEVTFPGATTSRTVTLQPNNILAVA